MGDNDVVDVTFFNKEVYDYPIATRPVEATAQRLVYINDDFSRTRGFELVYRRRPVKRFGGGASYEFQIATGKPADPNRIKQVDPEALETGDAEPDLTEQYMPWNRPHRVQLDVGWRFADGDHPKLAGVTLPDRWSANFYYTFRSGRPYTPTTTRREQTGKRNSANAPFENVFDAKIEKSWALRGRTTLGLTFQARNLLNTQILRTVDPNTGKAPVAGEGVYFFTPSDDEKDQQRLRDQLSNPAFYAEPRNLRLSMEVNF
jgi:outer membrane receptor protein involved in Fe transport